jgi:GNAT superfamily N-acetyltransferase
VAGVLCHYNPPYGDIFMSVAESFRRRGYGSYPVQELERVAYEMGKVPAARFNAANGASRATLQRAGLLQCARVLTGRIAPLTVEATESR